MGSKKQMPKLTRVQYIKEGVRKEEGLRHGAGVVDGAQRGRCATMLKPAGIGKQPRKIENVIIT